MFEFEYPFLLASRTFNILISFCRIESMYFASLLLFSKDLTLVWNCNFFILFHVLQVRCSWSVHAFGWYWLVTDRCCTFILRNQGLLILSLSLDVLRLLQYDNVVKSSAYTDHTPLFYLLKALNCLYSNMINFLGVLWWKLYLCPAHNNHPLISFHPCGVSHDLFHCQSHVYRKMVTNCFFSVLVQFLRPILHGNS